MRVPNRSGGTSTAGLTVSWNSWYHFHRHRLNVDRSDVRNRGRPDGPRLEAGPAGGDSAETMSLPPLVSVRPVCLCCVVSFDLLRSSRVRLRRIASAIATHPQDR